MLYIMCIPKIINHNWIFKTLHALLKINRGGLRSDVSGSPTVRDGADKREACGHRSFGRLRDEGIVNSSSSEENVRTPHRRSDAEKVTSSSCEETRTSATRLPKPTFPSIWVNYSWRHSSLPPPIVVLPPLWNIGDNAVSKADKQDVDRLALPVLLELSLFEILLLYSNYSSTQGHNN